MVKKYDDFDEPERNGVFGQIASIISSHKRGFGIACAAVAVVLLGVIVFGGDSENAEMAASESVPVVRADAEDYKSAPDNPGGMEIPYRDSTVFSANGDIPKTENILADDSTEEPLPREQLFAGLNTDSNQTATAQTAGMPPQPGTATGQAASILPSAMPSQGQLSGTNAQTATMEKVAPVLPGAAPSTDPLVAEAIGTQPSPTANATIASIQPKIIEPAPTEQTAKTEPKAADKAVAKVEPAAGMTAAKGVQPGGYYVQLASVKSTDGASAEYKKLQAKYTGLSGLKYRTQEANLGAKGTFHRIQAGPMSKDSATGICNDIKAKGGSCLVAGK